MHTAKKTLLLAGCGALGQAVAARLRDSGWHLLGLRRNTAVLPDWIEPLAADLLAADCPASWPRQQIDYVLFSLTPAARDAAAYRRAYLQTQHNLYRWLRQHGQKPRHLLFVSSIGVYGQDAGQWVDEQSETRPQRWSGQIMLQAEELARSSGIAASMVRLAGIYGGARQSFLQRVAAGYHADGCSNRLTNRIHEQDAAALLAHLLQLAAGGTRLAPVYLGVDDAPVEQAEVVSWLQQQLKVAGQPQLLLGKAGTSKRCSNALARSSGWRPQYADFRAGYAQLLR